MKVTNIDEPVIINEINVHGVSLNTAQPGEMVQLWSRFALTSDDRRFERIATELKGLISAKLSSQKINLNLNKYETILLVIKPNNIGLLWLDSAANCILVTVKTAMESGSIVYEDDICDVLGMDFPDVKIEANDRVISIIRIGWKFGVFLDGNLNGKFDREAMKKTLGWLYRTLKYKHLYELLSEKQEFDVMVSKGWFPFAEVSSEIHGMFNHLHNDIEFGNQEKLLCGLFDRARLDRILARWLPNKILEEREVILREAFDSFVEEKPVAVIKIILTEIEGIIRDKYNSVHNNKASLKTLLEFTIKTAEQRLESEDTLMFTGQFLDYLKNCTFANFDPDGPKGNANSRHAIGHGAAAAHTYTKIKALQAILTLDQIMFYLA